MIPKDDEVQVHKEMEVNEDEAQLIFQKMRNIQLGGGDIRDVIHEFKLKGKKNWAAYVLGINIGKQKLKNEAETIATKLVRDLRGKE